MRLFKYFFIIFVIFSWANNIYALPAGFVYLKDIDPTILQEIKYYSSDNFIGRRIKGYEAPKCILTLQAALALSRIQKQLKSKHFSLKVYDCYRPVIAVNDFVDWSRHIKDQSQKQKYYPLIDKKDFFILGYAAEKSGHSRGSTADLTLVQYINKKPVELSMGTRFDFMDIRSHPLYPKISGEIKRNRLFLRLLMINAGFKPIETEWWHFTLKKEPFINHYFNFPIK